MLFIDERESYRSNLVTYVVNWVEFVCQIGSFFMINLCLVVIATQFSETKKREMEKMLVERRRMRQKQQNSCSTLASSSDLQPGDCYEEMLKYAEHLARKSRRHLRRFARRGQRAVAACRRQAEPKDAAADDAVEASPVIVCGHGRGSSTETQPPSVAVCEVDSAEQNDETLRRLSRDARPSYGSSSSVTARRPSSLQIDSSSSSGSLRNSPAFASVVSLVRRPSSSTPPVDAGPCAMSPQVRSGEAQNDAAAGQPLAADTAAAQYLVLPFEVLGDARRGSSATPSPSPSPIPSPAILHVASPAPSTQRARSTCRSGSVQFVDTVKTCVHRTASVGHRRTPDCNRPLLVRKAKLLSSGENVGEAPPSPSSLIKSASFNDTRRGRGKCFRFSPETEKSRQAADDKARRDYDATTDGQRRRTSGPPSSASSTVSPVSPNFLEVPAAHADVPSGPSERRRVSGPVLRAASFSLVEVRPQRTHPPCITSLSVPSSAPNAVLPLSPVPATVAAAAAGGNRLQRPRSFRVKHTRAPSLQHRAVRRAVSCRATTRRAAQSSVTVGRASSLNEGARGRRIAAETAAGIGQLGLFGSDFLFCSQTQLSSTADIYRRMQQRARLRSVLSNDSGTVSRRQLSYLYPLTLFYSKYRYYEHTDIHSVL